MSYRRCSTFSRAILGGGSELTAFSGVRLTSGGLYVGAYPFGGKGQERYRVHQYFHHFFHDF